MRKNIRNLLFLSFLSVVIIAVDYFFLFVLMLNSHGNCVHPKSYVLPHGLALIFSTAALSYSLLSMREEYHEYKTVLNIQQKKSYWALFLTSFFIILNGICVACVVFDTWFLSYDCESPIAYIIFSNIFLSGSTATY